MHGMVSPMRRRARALFGAVVLLGFFSLGGFDQGARAQTPLDRLPAYLKNFPNFNKALTSPFPGDVDTALQQRLAKEKKFAEIQRLFDLDAWQMFVAVNWPTNNEGHARRRLPIRLSARRTGRCGKPVLRSIAWTASAQSHAA